MESTVTEEVDEEQKNPLAPAKGCINGIIISVVLWAIILGIVLLVYIK
jgi:hypothetical protein